MIFQEKDFTLDLKEKINSIEIALYKLIEILLDEYKPTFAKKGLEFNAEFDRIGRNPFQPGYTSSISIGISDDEKEELTHLHTIKIWECERYFLGVPISKKIPGSKVTGELLDETYEDIELELKAFIVEQLTINEG
ncbi:hypothetical protein [Alkalihalophilus marmarensis]|uniref:hypothetical protein n=1 Tax=Alkalihalophilus marmarensis TaxID=521377 RepID=UPI002E2236EA|nr:hypothetical protein [Alkalihalophilus marmarensis]